MQPSAPSAASRPLLGLGAFQNTKKGDKASFGGEDIQEILRQARHGSADEKELAIDILVNLAAGKDENAQLALRALYADPYGSDMAGSSVGQHAKDEIRQDLAKAAHRMCELALTDTFQPKDNQGRALSVTVAYLGAQHPACTPDFRRDINGYVHSEMAMLGDNESSEDWLASQRTVSQAELLSAGASAYGDALGISESAINLALDLDPSAQPEQARAQHDFERSMYALTKDLAVGDCRATWVHTGSASYPHWMPVVVKRTAEGRFDLVLLHTDKSNETRAQQVVDRFQALAAAAGPLDADWNATFVTSDAQDRAGHGCAPLGHEFLKTVGVALDEGSTESLADIANRCTERWESMSDADLTAMVQGNRAELVSARAQFGAGMTMPRPSTPPQAAPLHGEAVSAQPADEDQENQVADLVDSMKIGVSPAPGKGYTSTVGDLCAAINTCKSLGMPAQPGVAGKDHLDLQRIQQRKVVQDEFIASQPESFQSILRAAVQLEKTISDLNAGDGSPVLTDNFERTETLKSQVGKLQLHAGSWVQKITGLDLQMKTLVGHAVGAASPDKDKAAQEFRRFEKLLVEINTTVEDRVRVMKEALDDLNAILAHGKDWFDGRGAYDTGHSKVQADAQKLKDALVPWLEAIQSPDGEIQKLASFAKEAAANPQEAIKAIQAKVVPSLYMLE